MGYDAHDKIPELTRRYAILGQEIGALDGYHWNIAHWGTKWDVYSEHMGIEELGWQEGCESICFGFDTAWSPPVPWLEKVADMFPTLTFLLHYEEPGCYFAGDVSGEKGKIYIRDYKGDELAEAFRWMFDDDPEDSEVTSASIAM